MAKIAGSIAFITLAMITFITISSSSLQSSQADSEWPCNMNICVYQITASNVTYAITYQLAGSVTNMTMDSERKSLIVEVTTPANYTEFQVLLPTNLIQATTDPTRQDSSKQIHFTVLIDGSEASFEEDTQYLLDKQDIYRSLVIPYEAGQQEIEIIGTWIAPKFQEQALNQDSIEVQVGNKTYQLDYQMSNNGSIQSVSSDPYLTMVMNVTSPSNGTLQLTFSRELYDALTFTEHTDPLAVLDGVLVDELVAIDSSCEQTSLTIPVQTGTREVELLFSDILMNHIHTYPGKIDLLKTIEEEGQQFNVRLVTDAKKCDASFVKEEKKIQIEIQGRSEVSTTDEGYFRLTVPHGLLGGNYTVLVDGKEVEFTEQVFSVPDNMEIYIEGTLDDHTGFRASHLEFNYPKNASRIDVIGTTSVSDLTDDIDYPCMIGVCTYEFTMSNITHMINYRMAGIIKNMTVDVDRKSLTLDLQNYGTEMRIALPKELIKAEDEQNNNKDFVIFVGGKESVYSDLSEKAIGYYSGLGITENLQKYRVISMGFSRADVKQIEIVGTWIAPEFSSSLVIALVMVTAIVGTVIWSRLWYRQKRI